MFLLGIDPGRDKCGVAVLNSNGELKFQEVVATSELEKVLQELTTKFDLLFAILGNGTTHKSAEKVLEKFLPVKVVEESHTTEDARREYWLKKPPTGWRKFLPVSMQVPPEPVDAIVAEILVRRYLESGAL